MIQNLVRVTGRDGVWVTVTAASATGCARCDAGEGCGGGVFGKLVRRRLDGLRLAEAELDLQPGQHAVLGLDDGVFLRVVLLTYGLPLLALLLGSAAATALGASDALVALSGAAALILAMLAAPRLRERLLRQQLKPRLLRRITLAQWECRLD